MKELNEALEELKTSYLEAVKGLKAHFTENTDKDLKKGTYIIIPVGDCKTDVPTYRELEDHEAVRKPE